MDSSTSDYEAFDVAAINKPPQKFEGAKLAVVLLLLLVSGSCNFVLLKILFAAYGEASAFFVSQGINVLYIVYGGMVVYPRLLPCGLGDRFSRAFGFGPILPSMRTLEHHRRFLVMGVLDCFGTFLTAMGAVYVPGQYQTLINQSLIPTTMLASWLFLRTTFSSGQLASALLIVGGAALSIYPQVCDPQAISIGAGRNAGWISMALRYELPSPYHLHVISPCSPDDLLMTSNLSTRPYTAHAQRWAAAAPG